MLRALVVMVSLFGALSAAGRVRAVRHPSGPISPKSVMWIAAHPDDEAVAAPLLAKWCLDDKARCAFLVLTRGEAGACLRDGGCSPDTRSVRAAEAASASELFRADSILLRLPDGGGVEPPRWEEAEGQFDVVSTVALYIQAFRPELILTFDPRHGTTCHPDHRATGRIVLEATKRLPFETKLYFLETRVSISTNPLTISFAPATPSVERFDATQLLSSTGEPAWNAIVTDMERHSSQFDKQWIAAIANVPLQQRVIDIAPAASILEQPVLSCE